MIIDTHCHIDDQKLIDNTNEIIKDCSSIGVGRIINVGINKETSIKGKEFSEKYPEVYFAVGYHPSDILDLRYGIEEIKELSKHDKCVAIGEIGLDYHWEDYPDKKTQIEGFISQINLANQVDLPISVHSRDATEDTLKTLKENKVNRGGVMHCFSGSVETLKEYLKLGFYISFGGTLTFKNAKNLLEVASVCPLDRILTETDSPYLSPEPFRGKINTPKNVIMVLEKLAEIKGIEVKKMQDIVYENALRLFYKLG